MKRYLKDEDYYGKGYVIASDEYVEDIEISSEYGSINIPLFVFDEYSTEKTRRKVFSIIKKLMEKQVSVPLEYFVMNEDDYLSFKDDCKEYNVKISVKHKEQWNKDGWGVEDDMYKYDFVLNGKLADIFALYGYVETAWLWDDMLEMLRQYIIDQIEKSL